MATKWHKLDNILTDLKFLSWVMTNETPIVINGREVEIKKDEVKVGCHTVSRGVIEKILNKTKLKYHKILEKIRINSFSKKPSQMMIFRLLTPDYKWIFNYIEKNKRIKNSIYGLNIEDLEYILEGLLFGDATKQNKNCIEFRGQEKDYITLVQTICCLLGYRSKLSIDDKGYYRLFICKRPNLQFNNLNKSLKEVDYKGIVWCPQTINHTFLAKRNNSIFLTGNSGGKYMVKKNINPLTMQRIMGHNSLQTTLIYCAIDDKQADENYHNQIK
jgi:hypothetical protein